MYTRKIFINTLANTCTNKRRTYGVVAPHVVLPFVLDDSGGLGKRRGLFVSSAGIGRGVS